MLSRKVILSLRKVGIRETAAAVEPMNSRIIVGRFKGKAQLSYETEQQLFVFTKIIPKSNYFGIKRQSAKNVIIYISDFRDVRALLQHFSVTALFYYRYAICYELDKNRKQSYYATS